MPPRSGETDDLLGNLRPNAPISVVKAAKASLKEPSRPYTPADSGRQLFASHEHGQNRPTSSYGVPTSKNFYEGTPKLPLGKLGDAFSQRQERRDGPFAGGSRTTPAETVAALKLSMGAIDFAKNRQSRLQPPLSVRTDANDEAGEEDGPGGILDPHRNDDLPVRPTTSRGRPSSAQTNEEVTVSGKFEGPAPLRMGHNAQVLDTTKDGSDSDSPDDDEYRHLYSYAMPRPAEELAQGQLQPAAEPGPGTAGTAAPASRSGSAASSSSASAPLHDSLDPTDPIYPWRAAVEDSLSQLVASTSAFATATGPAQRDAMSDVLRHTTALGAHIEYMRKQPHSTRWLNAPSSKYRDVSTGHPLTVREAVSEHVFRLMDSTNAELLLKGCGIVLRVVKTRQPLLQASKLLYRLSKDTANDNLFRRERLLEPLLRTVTVMVASASSSSSSNNSTATSMHEPLVYLNGCLKNVSNDASNQRALVKLGALQVLASLLTTMASQIDSTSGSTVQKAGLEGLSASSSTSDLASQVGVQVTGVLRNLAVSPAHASSFVSSGVLSALRVTTAALLQQQEVVLNVGRILSKLSLYEECQAAMESDKEYAPLLVKVLSQSAGHRAILLRVAFVLGNLTTNSNEYRQQIAAVPGALDSIISIMQRYAMPSAALEDAAGAGGQQDARSDRLSKTAKHEDCVIKMLRLVANLAIHPEVGPTLAARGEVVGSLLALLGSYKYADAEELVLNCVCALTNMSFYHGPANKVLLADPSTLLCHVTPLLMCDNEEAMVEAARAYGNFSRMPDAREYMQTARVLEAMLLLLDHSNLELLYSICGTLINFTVDSDRKEALVEMGGITRLMEVLERVVTSAEVSDIEVDILVVVFKALYNVCADDAAPGEPLSERPSVTEEEITTMEAIVEHIRGSDDFAVHEEVLQLSERLVAQLQLISQKLESLNLEPL